MKRVELKRHGRDVQMAVHMTKAKTKMAAKSKAKTAGTLNERQRRFVEEYLVDLNATQAAIRAGYSKKTAYRTGADNLKKPQISKAIQGRIQKRSERAKIDADYVLNRLVEIDELDVADILDGGGNMLPVQDWPKQWRQSITGIDIQQIMIGDAESVIRKIKWPDKLRNLELLGKHVNVKAFEEEKGGGSDDLAEALAQLIEKMPG